MALIDRVKERVAPDTSDAELTAMITAIIAELDTRLGPVGERTVELGDLADPDTAWQQTLRLPQAILPGQPVTITEREPGNSGAAGAATVLSASDYRVVHGGRTLQRLTSGPNPRRFWAPLVTVTFTPVGVPQSARDEAVIKLMQLDLSYRGLIKSEKAGDYQWQGSLSSDSYTAERAAILNALATREGMVLA